MSNKGKLNERSEFSQRDRRILNRFALALIYLNMNEMEKRGFNAHLAIDLIPESEMTEQLKDLRRQILSFSPADT